MPATSARTLLSVIHGLNNEINNLVKKGDDIALELATLDFTDIRTDPSAEQDLSEALETLTTNFNRLNAAKIILMDGLRAKVINQLNKAPQSSRVKSARKSSKSRSARKTQRRTSV